MDLWQMQLFEIVTSLDVQFLIKSACTLRAEFTVQLRHNERRIGKRLVLDKRLPQSALSPEKLLLHISQAFPLVQSIS